MVSLPRKPLVSKARHYQASPEDTRFERGMRSAIDHLAPAAMEASRSHLMIDGRYVRVLRLGDYLRYVHPNWLAPADRLRRAARLEHAHRAARLRHHHPPANAQAGRTAVVAPTYDAGLWRTDAGTHRLVELQSSRLLDTRSGKIASTEREVAYEDVQGLRDALQRGEERVFSVSLYVCLRAASAAEAHDLNRRVETALGGMMASSRAVLFEMFQGMLSCLPAGRDYLGRYRNLDTTSVATMIPFTSSHLSMHEGILYGVSVHNSALVIFDPFSRE